MGHFKVQMFISIISTLFSRIHFTSNNYAIKNLKSQGIRVTKVELVVK